LPLVIVFSDQSTLNVVIKLDHTYVAAIMLYTSSNLAAFGASTSIAFMWIVQLIISLTSGVSDRYIERESYMNYDFTIFLILISSTILTGATQEQLQLTLLAEKRNIEVNLELTACKKLNELGSEYHAALILAYGDLGVDDASSLVRDLKKLINYRSRPPILDPVAFHLFNELSSFATFAKVSFRNHGLLFDSIPENVYLNISTDISCFQEVLVQLLVGVSIISVRLHNIIQAISNIKPSYSKIFNEQ